MENKLTEEGGSNALGGCNPKFKNLQFVLSIIGLIKSSGIGCMGPEVRKPHGGLKAQEMWYLDTPSTDCEDADRICIDQEVSVVGLC